jgi:hypothetical protein
VCVDNVTVGAFAHLQISHVPHIPGRVWRININGVMYFSLVYKFTCFYPLAQSSHLFEEKGPIVSQNKSPICKSSIYLPSNWITYVRILILIIPIPYAYIDELTNQEIKSWIPDFLLISADP